MRTLVRVIIYASLLMTLLDAPQYDWRRSLPSIGAVGGLVPPMQRVTPPTIFQPGAQAAVAPPPNPAASGPGYYTTPDYGSLIQGDPGYTTVAASAAAETGAAGRNRANLIRQALIQFGYAPPNWQSGYGDVDAPTLAAATQNPFSAQKQLQLQRSRASSDLAASLGARGILSSGALTGGEQLIQRNFDEAQNSATQQLLQALGGYESGYADTERSLEQQRMAAYNEASGRVAQLYPAIFHSTAAAAPGRPPVSGPVYDQGFSYGTYAGGGQMGTNPPTGGISASPLDPAQVAALHAVVQPPSAIEMQRRYGRLPSFG